MAEVFCISNKSIYGFLITSIFSSLALMGVMFCFKLPVFNNVGYCFYFCSSVIVILTNSVLLVTLTGYPKTIQVINWALVLIAVLSTFTAHIFTILNLLNVVGRRPPQDPVLIVALSSAFDTIMLILQSIVYGAIQRRLHQEHHCILGPIAERRNTMERLSRALEKLERQ